MRVSFLVNYLFAPWLFYLKYFIDIISISCTCDKLYFMMTAPGVAGLTVPDLKQELWLSLYCRS